MLRSRAMPGAAGASAVARTAALPSGATMWPPLCISLRVRSVGVAGASLGSATAAPARRRNHHKSPPPLSASKPGQREFAKTMPSKQAFLGLGRNGNDP